MLIAKVTLENEDVAEYYDSSSFDIVEDIEEEEFPTRSTMP